MRLGWICSFFAAAALTAQPLPTPTGLEASNRDYADKIGLSWDHVRGAKLYRVFRSTSDDPSTAQPVGQSESVLFFDRTAGVEQTYYYWLRAEDGQLQSELSEPVQGVRAQGETFMFNRLAPLQPPDPPRHDNPVTGAKVYLGKLSFGKSSSLRPGRCRAAPATSRATAAPTSARSRATPAQLTPASTNASGLKTTSSALPASCRTWSTVHTCFRRSSACARKSRAAKRRR